MLCYVYVFPCFNLLNAFLVSSSQLDGALMRAYRARSRRRGCHNACHEVRDSRGCACPERRSPLMAPVRNRCPLRRSTGRLERLSRSSCAQHTDNRLGHLRVLYESRDVSLFCEPEKIRQLGYNRLCRACTTAASGYLWLWSEMH